MVLYIYIYKHNVLQMKISTFAMFFFMWETSFVLSHWLFEFIGIPPEVQNIFFDEAFVAGTIFALMWLQIDMPGIFD